MKKMNRQDMRETVNAVAYLAGCAVRQTVPDARNGPVYLVPFS